MSERRLNGRMPAGRVAYVGGRYVTHGQAHVHIEDRGLQFADSIYEAFALIDGHILDEKGHLDRLERSLRELHMPMPLARSAIATVLRETVRRNRVRDGFIYLQVTRGAAKRDHAIPANVHPLLIVTVRPVDVAQVDKRRAEGVAVATAPDIRWGRCDIKTTSLTANVLAKTEGRAKGAYEVWLVDKDNMVTEGASTSAWIVTKDGRIVTRDLHANILPGVTRATLIRALAKSGVKRKAGRTRIQRDRSPLGAGGVHHRGVPRRDAGGEDRWPRNRRRQAGAGRAPHAGALSRRGGRSGGRGHFIVNAQFTWQIAIRLDMVQARRGEHRVHSAFISKKNGAYP